MSLALILMSAMGRGQTHGKRALRLHQQPALVRVINEAKERRLRLLCSSHDRRPLRVGENGLMVVIVSRAVVSIGGLVKRSDRCSGGCRNKDGRCFESGTMTCATIRSELPKRSSPEPPSASAAPTPNPSLPGRGELGGRSPSPSPRSPSRAARPGGAACRAGSPRPARRPIRTPAGPRHGRNRSGRGRACP